MIKMTVARTATKRTHFAAVAMFGLGKLKHQERWMPTGLFAKSATFLPAPFPGLIHMSTAALQLLVRLLTNLTPVSKIASVLAFLIKAMAHHIPFKGLRRAMELEKCQTGFPIEGVHSVNCSVSATTSEMIPPSDMNTTTYSMIIPSPGASAVV